MCKDTTNPLISSLHMNCDVSAQTGSILLLDNVCSYGAALLRAQEHGKIGLISLIFFHIC